jgi:hypothetical protein
MVGSSVRVWQETHPADFLSGSSQDGLAVAAAARFSPAFFAGAA